MRRERPSRGRNRTAEFDPDLADPVGVPHSQAPLYLSHRVASLPPKHEERPMIVHDLSTDVVSKMIRSDLAGATEEPPSQIEPFDFCGCTCGVASFIGSPPWEFHSSGDEVLHVLAGSSKLTVRQEGEEGLLPQKRGARRRDDAAHDPPRGWPPLLGRSRILETRSILWRLATTATHTHLGRPPGCHEGLLRGIFTHRPRRHPSAAERR